MHKTMLAIVMAAAIGAVGCFGTTHLSYSIASLQNTNRQESKVSTHNWFFGLVKGQGAIMGAVCGTNGVATVDVEHALGDWLWFVFTFGIYNQTTVTFTCQ